MFEGQSLTGSGTIHGSEGQTCCAQPGIAGKDGYGMIVEDVSQHLADFAAFYANYSRTIEQHSPFPLLSDLLLLG